MSRIWALTMVLCLLLCMTACGKDSTVEQAGGSEHHAMITKAVAAVKDHWRSLYETDGPGTDGYFEIKNTRVITVKKNELKLFQNVAYIIYVFAFRSRLVQVAVGNHAGCEQIVG